MFSLTKGEESYDEGHTIAYGKEVGSFEAPFGKVGCRSATICASPLIVVPAAFTYITGNAYWETLPRARAIENQCYVLAPAQGGKHPNGRRTWCHSILMYPWGEIKSVLAEGEGLVSSVID